MKSAQRLEKYQTCIVLEAVVAERKNLACTRVVALPIPLASASLFYAALSSSAVKFPFRSPKNSERTEKTLPHSKHHLSQ
jgi:hypothetical protein